MTSTDLLERYLAEVARNLPLSPERDDIVAEIGEEIQSKVDAGEATMYDAIKAYGHPKIVAARYKEHQYLIGPMWMPFYFYTLKMTLTIVLGVEIFGAGLAALATKNPSLFGTGLGAAWSSIMWDIGVVTVVFGLIERFGKNIRVPFDPGSLPAADDARVPRLTSGFEFIANFCTILVLLFAGPWVAKTIAPLILTAAWEPAWYATLAGNVLICSAAFAAYLSPAWVKVRHVAQITANIVMIVGCGLMLRGGGPYITQTGTDVGALSVGALNMMVMWSVGVVILTLAIASAVSLWKLLPFTTLRASRIV